MYGYEPGRARAATFPDLRPPFKTLWEHDTSLIEFPPVAANGKVFVAEARGHFYAADGATGDIVWEKQFKRCSAGSPAYADGVVYHAYMGTRCRRVPGAKGLVVAMDSETGKIKWRANTEVIESSLLYVKGSLYFGGWDGQIVSLDAKTGKQRWSYAADSGVTSSVAYHDGTLFVGSDGGSFYALDASSGKLRWKSGSFSTFGKREYFYATPAVAYGRVYAPNTDGYVYSFGEKSGKLRWARRVGTYVYSAPAIWKKTVYVGTYDGFLVAMDAATGDVKWKYSAPAAVHGAATIVDGVVYFSTLKGKHSGSARKVKNLRARLRAGLESGGALEGIRAREGDWLPDQVPDRQASARVPADDQWACADRLSLADAADWRDDGGASEVAAAVVGSGRSLSYAGLVAGRVRCCGKGAGSAAGVDAGTLSATARGGRPGRATSARGLARWRLVAVSASSHQ